MTLDAKASVEGLSSGTAWILEREPHVSIRQEITLDEAFTSERERLDALSHGGKEAGIFTAHLEMLDDPMLRETIDSHMADGMEALEAVEAASEEISAMLSELDDEYLRARADDVRDVCAGILRSLSGDAGNPFESIPEDAVIVAEELFPSDTAHMDFSKIRAFVTKKGSATSHVCIIARGHGVPVVLGVDIGLIKNGDRILVNGDEAKVTIDPTSAETVRFEASMNANGAGWLAVSGNLEECGVKVYGNAGSVQDVKAMIEAGADGIGLFRTEFLFMGSGGLPSEEDQYEIYSKAAKICGDKPLTIRTMDIGGDKEAPCLELPREDNPFLGMRAIRLCLSRPDLFKTQIRAILRAGSHGKIRMMLPMITRIEEIRETKALIEECAAALDSLGVPFDRNMEVGIMIETPAAVLTSDILATEADFFSIGSNDLTQYIMAADRGNASVAYLYNPLDSAMRRAIGIVTDAGRKAGIPVGVCGEMAADRRALEFLTGIGISSVSLTSAGLVASLTRGRR